MAKRKFVEELIDEELLKVVEDIESKMVNEMINAPENQSYVGPIPPSDTYDPDSMNPDKRQEFLNWYQFHGCVWHGCPRCHPNRRLVPRVHLDCSMEEVYDVTCAKTALLRSIGFTVVEMWECFWDDLSKHDPRLIQFLHTLETVEPLDPRHAFYGGRTGATCLYHKQDR